MPFALEMDPSVYPSKRGKTASGSSVQFDGVVLPKGTRRSTRSTKANSKKEVNELFKRLGQEFSAISKTCAEIAEAFE